MSSTRPKPPDVLRPRRKRDQPSTSVRVLKDGEPRKEEVLGDQKEGIKMGNTKECELQPSASNSRRPQERVEACGREKCWNLVSARQRLHPDRGHIDPGCSWKVRREEHWSARTQSVVVAKATVTNTSAKVRPLCKERSRR